jgi:hypothetical protein
VISRIRIRISVMRIHLLLTDPGGPETYGSYGSGSGSATLIPVLTVQNTEN